MALPLPKFESARSPVVQERRSVTVAVPATSANLGSGFDCLGMALDIWNELTVERSSVFKMEVFGEGAGILPLDETNLVVVGLKAAFKAAGKAVPPLKYTLRNHIPCASGMGSSSAAIVSGLVAGLVLTGHELAVAGEEGVLQLAAEIEGHPDNVAPAIYGGLQIQVRVGDRWYTDRVTTPHGLQCVLFLPDDSKRSLGTDKTKAARGILPDTVSRKDAVFNISHAALLVNAFATNNMDALRISCEDALHQPYRAEINPHLMPAVQAALKAGAHGAYLSGAGPGVLAFTSGLKGDVYVQRQHERKDSAIANAMLAAAQSVGVPGNVYLTVPAHKGCHVVSSDPPFSYGLRLLPSVHHHESHKDGPGAMPEPLMLSPTGSCSFTK